MKSQKLNMTFCLLSALGILFVVDGHVGSELLTFRGWLPYYGFHIQLFCFISGYFYKESAEHDLWGYTRKKFKRLMVPYYLWNLVYALFVLIISSRGFDYDFDPVGLFSLLVEPFRTGYQYVLNGPAWFVSTLFLIEILYAALRRCFAKRSFATGRLHLLLGASSLLLGFLGIALTHLAGVDGFLRTIERVLILLFWYEAGSFYKEIGEKIDEKIPFYLYFPIVFLLVFIQAKTGLPREYALWKPLGIPGYLYAYFVPLPAILFWLRIARILTPIAEKSRLIRWVGTNTYSVMMHHMTVWFFVQLSVYMISQNTSHFHSFDLAAWKTDPNYRYFPHHLVNYFYLASGILCPVMLQGILSYLGKKLRPLFEIQHPRI